MAAMVVPQAHQVPIAPRLGNLFSVGAVILFVGGLCLEVAFWLSSGRDVLTWTFIQTLSLTSALCLSGGILYRHAAARPVGALLLVSGCAAAWSFFSTALGNIALLQGSEWALPFHLIAQAVWPLYVIPMLTLLPLIFPTGTMPNRRWRVVVWGSVVSMVILIAATVTAEEFLIDKPGGTVLLNPFSVKNGSLL